MSYETQEWMHLFHLHAVCARTGAQSSLSQWCSVLDVRQRYLTPSLLAGEGWDRERDEGEEIWEHAGMRPL
jgi:hypothetical protein